MRPLFVCAVSSTHDLTGALQCLPGRQRSGLLRQLARDNIGQVVAQALAATGGSVAQVVYIELIEIDRDGLVGHGMPSPC